MDEGAPLPPADETARELRRLLQPMRRAVTRAMHPAGAPPFSEAQVELLFTLAHHGPLTVKQLAARLQLAHPTVSNLAKALAQAGLVTRELSPTDSRAVLLDISARAREMLAAAHADRDGALQQAIARLSDTDQATLQAALPVLARLLTHLRDAAHGDAADGDAGHRGGGAHRGGADGRGADGTGGGGAGHSHGAADRRGGVAGRSDGGADGGGADAGGADAPA